MILDENGVEAIVGLYKKTDKNKFALVKNLTWTASNFCRSKSNAQYSKIADIMTIFADIFQNVNDTEILV